MSLGKKKPKQSDMFISHDQLPTSPGHPFYVALNRLLHEACFDEQLDILCKPYYREGGRPSIPPGVYFRMLFVGFFEGIDSQRGIAWRCSDSLSLRQFLGLSISDTIPDHSSLTRWRQRLPLQVHEEVFLMVLAMAKDKKLLTGKRVGVDSTTLEANAAMKSIVRRSSGEAYKKYLKRLAAEHGIEDPTDDDLRKFDRNRPGKKTSNEDWESPTDPDSRISRMKDGRTKLAYKAEHAVDLDSDIVVAAPILLGNDMDVTTLLDTVQDAQLNLQVAGLGKRTLDVVADKGYYSTDNLLELEADGHRPFIAEKAGARSWKKSSEDRKRSVYANRRRLKSKTGNLLQRLRCEMPERSFAHVCDQGGARRSWIRGIEEVSKRYLMTVAARNLSTIMRKLFGVGKPKGMSAANLACLCVAALISRLFRGHRTEAQFAIAFG